MTALVYRRPSYKPCVTITPEFEALITERLRSTSQQRLARELGISQSAISRVARRAKEAADVI